METPVSKVESLTQTLEAKVRSLQLSVEQLTQLAIESEALYTAACELRNACSARQSLTSHIHTSLTQAVTELQALKQDSDLNRTLSQLHTFLQSGRKRRKTLFSVTAS